MKKTILVYGLILGAIVTGNGIYMANMCNTNPHFETNDTLGFAALIVVYSLVFFGVRNYRNKFNDNQINFKQAFKTGLWITTISSLLYVIVWVFVYYLFMPGYFDQYVEHVVYKATKAGDSAAEIASLKEQMTFYGKLYQNPLFVVLSTFAEAFVVGLVASLISAFILRTRKGKEVGAAKPV